MPYCSTCGALAHERDLYCAKCGARQPAFPASAAAGPPADPLAGISPRLASILCYIPTVGWIAAVIVLASRKFRANAAVRFHAFQGLYLFAAWLFVQWAIHPVFMAMPDHRFFRIDRLLEGIILATWIFMIVKASNEEAYSLPVIGQLAHRSASER